MQYSHPEELMADADPPSSTPAAWNLPASPAIPTGCANRPSSVLNSKPNSSAPSARASSSLHYQPEVDLRTNRIIGFEALVRWNHARRGLLAPAEFIPLAEETGLIVPLGQWGLAEACRQLVEWRSTASESLQQARISVNLSGKQLEQPELIGQVETDPRPNRPPSRLPPPRSHREQLHLRWPRPATQHARAGKTRRRPSHGRLRHRLFLPRLPPALPLRHPQIDRSFVRGIA